MKLRTLFLLLTAASVRANEPGRLLLSEDLATPPAEIIASGSLGSARSGWKFISGQWVFFDGALHGGMKPTDQRGAQAVCVLPFREAVFQFDVRLESCRMVQFRLQDAAPEHICRVSITRDGFTAQKDDHDHAGPDSAVPFGRAALPIGPGEWKTVRVEIRGRRLTARIDDQTITGEHDLIAAPKHFFEFIVSGPSASFRHLRMWEAPPEAASAWITPRVSAPRVEQHFFESDAAKSRVSFHVYTPEIYDTENTRRFPALYWLHGTGGGEKGIAPLAAFFDRAIREGKIPPLLVVFPNGMASSMWCDSRDGAVPMETVVVHELVPFVDATFRTIARRKGRLLEGFSMGGYGAARLGLKYGGLFGGVSVLAGGPLHPEFIGPRTRANPAERERILQDVYGGDLAYFKAQSPWMLAEQHAAAARENHTRFRMAVGSRDFTADLNRQFSARLDELKIAHTFTEAAGVEHSALALLTALGEANWEFYRSAFAGAAAGSRFSNSPE